MAAVAEVSAPANTAAGLTGKWHQADVRGCLLARAARRKVQRPDQQPSRGDQANSSDCVEQGCCFGPRAIAQQPGQFVLQQCDALVELSDYGLQLGARSSNLDWPVSE